MPDRRRTREQLEDRMAQLAARIADPDEKERAYASAWLDHLWRIWEAARDRRDAT